MTSRRKLVDRKSNRYRQTPVITAECIKPYRRERSLPGSSHYLAARTKLPHESREVLLDRGLDLRILIALLAPLLPTVALLGAVLLLLGLAWITSLLVAFLLEPLLVLSLVLIVLRAVLSVVLASVMLLPMASP